MVLRGKTVQLFLMDKDVNARIKATVPGWTGVVYKIPRTALDACKDRDHLKQSGIYMLFGENDENGKPEAYVGQASVRQDDEGLLKRISEHKSKPEEEYWTEAIAITTTDDTFGPTELNYLENRFHGIVTTANRCTIKNDRKPAKGNISEEKESELEDFVDNILIIMGALGNKALVPFDEKEMQIDAENHAADLQETQPGAPTLFLKTSKVDASGRQTSEGFVVFKGSKLATHPTDSCPKHIRIKRDQYSSAIGDNSVLLEDVLFGSPSAASGFVKYASSNGRLDWVTKSGVSLQFLEEEQER